MKHAQIRVNLRVLREMLRLPPDVEITGTWSSEPDLLLYISGPNLPAEGELTANYTYQHTTHVTFTGFTKA